MCSTLPGRQAEARALSPRQSIEGTKRCVEGSRPLGVSHHRGRNRSQISGPRSTPTENAMLTKAEGTRAGESAILLHGGLEQDLSFVKDDLSSCDSCLGDHFKNQRKGETQFVTNCLLLPDPEV